MGILGVILKKKPPPKNTQEILSVYLNKHYEQNQKQLLEVCIGKFLFFNGTKKSRSNLWNTSRNSGRLLREKIMWKFLDSPTEMWRNSLTNILRTLEGTAESISNGALEEFFKNLLFFRNIQCCQKSCT